MKGSLGEEVRPPLSSGSAAHVCTDSENERQAVYSSENLINTMNVTFLQALKTRFI
ncbi:hypothetical protein I79_009146 [Cricetulus griseus]|uniref:Uncharacterized protein n=1 Tax=Cricetulus griseus TaxID=10029 RepID=G3HEZ5_CRIGR|nr:hypothetical protein I79_009146 [Cricetulus griseus]